MEKQTITIPPGLIRTLILGFIISILIVFTIHLFGKWYATPFPPSRNIGLGETSYLPMTAKVQSYQVECAFDEAHFFEGKGVTFENVVGGHFSSAKFFGCVSATFEKHWKNIFLFWLLSAGLIFLFQRVKFKIGKTTPSSMTPTTNFSTGDILLGKKGTDAIHPIVYLKEKDADFFIGAMITKSDKFSTNIPMKKEHFKENDSNGSKFELAYYNSHLVKAKLIKRNEWQPFRKVGELTGSGISFVEANIDTREEQLWEDFLKG